MKKIKFRVAWVLLLFTISTCLTFMAILLIGSEGDSAAGHENRDAVFRRPKVVLLWNSWMDDPDWKEIFSLNNYSTTWRNPTNPHMSCILTTHDALLPIAAAVVIHGPDYSLDMKMPRNRPSSQKLIYLSLEAEPNSGMTDEKYLKSNAIGYDWTMTYRPSADVPYPYGRLSKRSKPLSAIERLEINERINKFAAKFYSRDRDGFWMVSNCKTQGMREDFFDKLKLFGNLKSDKWGRCAEGRFKSPREE